MKLEQIPGDYDNVDQRALELLKTNDYELAEYMRDYIKELYANIHMRDFYIRNLKDEILHTLKHRDSISGEELLQILNKVAPWDMEYDGRWQTRDYLARAKANQEVELVEEALYRNAYIYPGWKYCLPGLLKTIYL